jgi:hypothetical protein
MIWRDIKKYNIGWSIPPDLSSSVPLHSKGNELYSFYQILFEII